MILINTKVKILILLILWVITFIPIYPDLMETWFGHSNNSHGVLVPIISAFLVWQNRDILFKSAISSYKCGMFIIVISMLLYVLSYTGGIALVSRLMIVSSLIGLVLYNFGPSVYSVIQFPLLYLLFMVPVPASLYSLVALPLQIFATKVSTLLINALSIPVYREGTMLYFMQTNLEVAEQCSGLHSMTSFIMLSFLFAYMLDNKWWKRIFLVISAIPLAIFANIVRVTGTGILANFYGAKVARGFLHEFSGMAVFVFGFILLIIEYLLLSKTKSFQKQTG